MMLSDLKIPAGTRGGQACSRNVGGALRAATNLEESYLQHGDKQQA